MSTGDDWEGFDDVDMVDSIEWEARIDDAIQGGECVSITIEVWNGEPVTIRTQEIDEDPLGDDDPDNDGTGITVRHLHAVN